MEEQTTARQLVSEMTAAEKVSLLSGAGFWHLKSIDRLGLPAIMVADGPHGLRKQASAGDHLGIGDSVPATCFPTASLTACSFDRDLLREMGVALGEECRQEDLSVLLGPGVNIKRNPLCGRNFEYFSEDPLLAGELAAAIVDGVQSQNVGVSLKHFAANNQETRRFVSDSAVDMRALRELYLAAFETVVKKAQPWTVMCSYNLIRGVQASENHWLMQDVLRGEWGFDGLVVTDWGAAADRVRGVRAGVDLQMPGGTAGFDQKLLAAVESGELPMADVDAAAENVVRLIQRSAARKPFRYDGAAHHALARRIATESSVLLKNENHQLPCPKAASIALIGAFADGARYQGSGSSRIVPLKLDTARSELAALGVEFTYAAGYRLDSDAPDGERIIEACEAASGKDRVFILAGLPDSYEAEGYDRASMAMPEAHNALIEAVADVNPNVTVILIGGAPMELPWADRVPGILLCYLGGEAGGSAIADLITGRAQPAGRLAETWPMQLSDVPSSAYFPGYPKSVDYRESVYVGYRYFDTVNAPVRFPFGHGLSYTEFAYRDLSLDRTDLRDTDTLTVSLTIENTGDAAGSEVVQLYVSQKNPTLFRPVHELRGFEKVRLQPGESRRVTFTLGRRAFAFFNVETDDWQVETGNYEIRLGASSRDIRLTGTVQIASTSTAAIPDYRAAAPRYYAPEQGLSDIPDGAFTAIYGMPLPPRVMAEGAPCTPNTTLGDLQHKWFGRIMYKFVRSMMVKASGESEDIVRSADTLALDMPLRSYAMSDGITPGMVDGLVDLFNGKFFSGIKKLLAK